VLQRSSVRSNVRTATDEYGSNGFKVKNVREKGKELFTRGEESRVAQRVRPAGERLENTMGTHRSPHGPATGSPSTHCQ
jgi:hypothetical protein